MPYVSRDDGGEIIALHQSPPNVDAEWLRGDDPEIQNFLHSGARAEQAKRSLSDSDTEMIRVIEDLVDLLIAKNIITFTDLPSAAQLKLGSRRQMREDLGMLANLIGKDDTFF